MDRRRCIAGLVGAALAALAHPVEAVDLEALAWASRCEALRAELSGNPTAAVTYTERDMALPMADIWTLVAHGFRVPVPARSYTDVIVQREGREPVTLILAAIDQTAVIVSSMPVEPLDDVFAMTAWTGETTPTEDGRAWTRELFGGPVDLGALTDIGYRSAPADLSCAPESWREDIPVAIALTIKTIGPGRLVHVYHQSDQAGWLTERDIDGQVVWEATRLEPGRVWFVNLSGPASGPVRDLGLAIDHPDLAATVEPPLWLPALEHALESDDPAAFGALADALALAGLSNRSVASARALAQPPSAP